MRACSQMRTVGGVCLNLCLGCECSLVPNSICMIHADAVIKDGFATTRLKRRIKYAKKLGVYSENSACIGLPI
jgi:hypothetical protein